MKVFITDADFKHALSALRSLGKKGIYVIAGSSVKHSQSFYSKYCKEKVIYPMPRNENAFVRFMLEYLKNNKIDVLLPICYLATTTISKYQDEFRKYTKLPVAGEDSIRIACNKDKTMEFAEKLGVKIPKIYKRVEEIKVFPVVVKGIRESGNVRYVNSAEELSVIKTDECILQEYVPGEGYGFFSLFNMGEARAIFMHKRIREYPITGGPSTAAESVYDNELKDTGLKLLKALNWHGIAMVEFKKDIKDGTFKLMEINPKFWGSLDLAIAAGVDFPYLAVKMAAEGDVVPVFNYDVGVKYRWPFPDDALHALAKPSSIKFFIRDFFNKRVKSNIWVSDIKPNLFQFFTTIYKIISLVKNRLLKYPHGIPKLKI